MNANNSPSAATAATMAFSTNAAGPSLQSFSKMDAIAHPETRVGLALGPLLVACVPCHVLPGRHLEAQTPAVGLRSEPPDLIRDGEVFRSDGEEDISAKALVPPVFERKSKSCNPGRTPFRTRPRESASRAGPRQGEGPLLR